MLFACLCLNYIMRWISNVWSLSDNVIIELRKWLLDLRLVVLWVFCKRSVEASKKQLSESIRLILLRLPDSSEEVLSGLKMFSL